MRDVVWRKADTVVWLDLPRRVVMRQVVARTLRRATLGTELWNGNRERWQDMLCLDPERSIILWSWTNHAKYHDRYHATMSDPAWRDLTFVRLGSQRRSRAVPGGLVRIERLGPGDVEQALALEELLDGPPRAAATTRGSCTKPVTTCSSPTKAMLRSGWSPASR